MIRQFTQFWSITFAVALVGLLLGQSQNATAQDIHFSQFYSSPLTLNPAMTGNVNGSYRIATTYRNQWASISPSPYSTVVASFDASLFGCAMETDHLGAGIAVFNDKAGAGNLNNLTGLVSLAYHKGLDRDRRFLLSVGGQAGFTQKKVDIQSLCFENQISNFECDLSVPNGEPFDNNQFTYFDFRGGGMFTANVNNNLNLYFGGSYYHFTKPTETFLLQNLPEAETNKLNPRMVFHGGGQLGGGSVSFSPSFIYMSQTGVNTYVAGGAFGYHFNKKDRYEGNSSLYLGAWYRSNDAVIALVGVDLQSFRFGFSYDINVSDLSDATLNQGGVEISLTYTGITSECNRSSKLYCPRF